MKIKKAEFIISGTKPEHFPENNVPEIVLLGRSNVGKSTFLNLFVNNKKMAYTSSNPGKTQVINFFDINSEFRLVDVPGYGYARVSQKKRAEFGQMIENYLLERKHLKFVLLLIDFKVGPTKDDILMYEYLKHYNKKILVVATKKDKVKKSQFNTNKENIFKELPELANENLKIYSKTDRNTLNAIYDYFDENLKESVNNA